MQDQSISPEISILRQMASQFAFADALTVGVYFCDNTGALLAFNRQCANLWGAEPQIATGGKFGGGCKTLDLDGTPLPASDDPMAVALATGKSVSGRELIFERPDGSRIFVEIGVQPVFEQGEAVGGIACIQDITKRKEAEVRLDSERQLLAAIVEATPECIKIVAPDGGLVQMNPAGRQMIEADADTQIEGAPVLNLVAPEFRDEWQANHKRVCNGEKLTWVFDIIGYGGTRREMETHAVPIRLQDGRVGQLAITRDITNRHEEELQAARLAAIVASSDDAIVSKTLEGFITTWNAGAERIFGYSAEEIIGQHITRIVPPELRSEEEGILARLRRGEHVDHFETVRVGKDGRRIDVSVTVSPMRDKYGKLIGASKVGRDITDR